MTQPHFLSRHLGIVIGLGFGDEGKGRAIDRLALAFSKKGIDFSEQIVIRFNGGQQAGHTVVLDAQKRHVFSQFGAASLRGVPTYWSRFCSLFPNSFLKEYVALKNLGVSPRLFWDRLCPVTTHYDQLYNRILEHRRGGKRHGSCGLGFGATMERHETSPYVLFAQDLENPIFLEQKLKMLRHYYSEKLRLPAHQDPADPKNEFAADFETDFEAYDHQAADAHFLAQVAQIQELVKKGVISFIDETSFFALPFRAWLFEGAQGVLLDRHYGLFPHVTRSHTDCHHINLLLENCFQTQPFTIESLEIQHVTRAYQTRHGAGWLPFEDPDFDRRYELSGIENETNQFNEFQGHFRKAPLSLQTLRYAMVCQSNQSQKLLRLCAPYLQGVPQKTLLITCLDQFPDLERLPFYTQETLERIPWTQMQRLILEMLRQVGETHQIEMTFSPTN
jgi:adenylosuccinate synthase